MAQYGGEQYMKQEGQKTEEYGQNPLHSTTAGHHEMGTDIHSTTTGHGIGNTGTMGTGGGHEMGTNIHSTGTTVGTGGGHGDDEGKHGGILHRTGSGGSSSSEDDGEGGRRKKKSVMDKIKEKLPGGGEHGGDEQYKTSDTTTTTGGNRYSLRSSSQSTDPSVGAGEGHGYGGKEGHENKGLMDKIKDKLPGGNH